MSYKNRLLDWMADHDGKIATDPCIVRVNKTRYISGLPYFTTGFRENAYVFASPEKVHEFCKLAGQETYEIISWKNR